MKLLMMGKLIDLIMGYKEHGYEISDIYHKKKLRGDNREYIVIMSGKNELVELMYDAVNDICIERRISESGL